MSFLQIGPVHITFHRTVRVSLDETSSLPPSLGVFPVYRVKDYKGNCPKTWKEDDIFIAMHDKEALWLAFQTMCPTALAVNVGGINAVTGEKAEDKLTEGSYLVAPPQPWLDGWKGQDGSVYQFVTTEFKKGEGKSVGEQVLGSECESGGMKFTVFEAKEPEKLRQVNRPHEIAFDGVLDPNSFAPQGAMLCSLNSSVECSEMGVGKGGKIEQKIYPDPHGLKVWKEEHLPEVNVYLINGPQFTEITEQLMPPLPQSFENYKGVWFGLEDKELPDAEGTDTFDKLEEAF